ncbi:MAG: VWA domain-containing protein [Acidobacteria bacterium]|nr:VWA domain-containing protein [Acidobacteriota bacterium]
MRKVVFLAVVVMTVLTIVIFGQSQSTEREQKLTIGTSEVPLDIVVKDKKGKPIRDLKASDFEVYEDGVKQQIESFRLITKSASSSTKTEEPLPVTPTGTSPIKPIPTKSRDVETGISAVALVFDRLNTDARKRAHTAAMSYLGQAEQQESYMGVFSINLGLSTLQNYTTQTALIRKAIDRAGIMASSTFDQPGGIVTADKAQMMNQTSAAVAGAIQAASGGGAAAASAGSAAGAASVDLQFQQMELRTKETFDVLQRDQQGYATVNGLMAVISSMQRLPGRKAVMFFSEGAVIPPNVRQQFRSVINNANRANVSVYTIDSAGLRAESTTAASRDEINNRSRMRMDNLDSAMRTSGPLTTGLERNEDLINLNPQNGLMQLAQETGGQFIGDTNNIAPRLKQVDEDLNTYYMMTYVPTNQNFDGKFRTINVKLNRGGADLQSRKGYYAVNVGSGTPVLYYETPALAALSAGRGDNSIPIKTASFNFPEVAHLGRTTFSVEMPANAFSFIEDKVKKTYGSDFSVVVLVKDENKQVVRKISTHYTLDGPLDQLPKMKNGLILFYREEDLPPGHFDIEVAAYDLPTNKISIRKATIDVPDANENKLRLSSITLVKRGEQLAKDQKLDSPFLFGDVLLYPNLGEPISKAAKQLGFFFTVYPAKGSTFAPALTVELSQGGKVIASVPLKLPAPNESGKLPYVGNLPLESLAPGDYDMRVAVRTDKGSASRTTKFTIVP